MQKVIEYNNPCVVRCLRVFCFIVAIPLLLSSCKPHRQQAIRWNVADASCNRTFVIRDVRSYQMYIWEPHQLTLLYSGGYPREYYVDQSAFVCEANEVIITRSKLSLPSDIGLTHLKSDERAINVRINEGPNYFEQYAGHLLLHTVRLNVFDNPQPSLEDVMRSPDGTYQEFLDYNLMTRKVEATYPHPGFMNFMFRVGKNMYIGTSWGMLWRINLDTQKTTKIYTPEASIPFPQFAVTRDERAFFLYIPRQCVSDSREDCLAEKEAEHASPFHANTVYEITSGAAVELFTSKYSDTTKILGVEKDIYLFTRGSQRAIKYNTENQEIIEYQFPFQYLTNINYLDRSFVLCYDPQGRESGRYNIPCLVSDDTFENSTKPVIVDVVPSGIATSYRNSGGNSGPM